VWGEYHPPLNGNPDDAYPGFMIEIAQSVFEKHGHSIDYILGPRARAVHKVRAGEVDCVVNAKIQDHHFLAFPEQPWGYHAATLFSLPASTFRYDGIATMTEVNLGAISGMRYDNGVMDEYLGQAGHRVTFSYGAEAMDKQVKMLLAKRVDTLVSCPLLMRGQMKSMKLDSSAVKVVGEVKPFVGMYLACGKGRARTENYIKQINETIPKMRASGELQAILDRYGQIDWFTIYRSLNQPQ